jgi:E3 ubiquitin-protein ligase HUWE1
MRNTKYGNLTKDAELIVWFWEIVNSISDEDVARLLQFSTGTSRVPINGFAALRGKYNEC